MSRDSQPRLRRILREPLLHFLALGALLFGLYGALNRGAPGAPDEIVVDRVRLESLAAQFERVWQRPPTEEELRDLVDGWVREEVLYREGLALGLDRDDPVVRRRVGQKLSFLADAQAPAEAPGEAELQAWLEAHPDDYRVDPRYGLRQVYFDPARRGARLAADVAAARAALERGAGETSGDATLLPASLEEVGASELARVFGQEFAQAVSSLPVGGWHGPLPSAFGVHLVELRSREPGRLPAVGEVRAELERDWLRARSEEATEAFYQSLRGRYRVRVEDGAESADVAGARETP